MKKSNQKIINAVKKTKSIYYGVDYPILDTGYKLRNADFKTIMANVRKQVAHNFTGKNSTDRINTRVLNLSEYSKDAVLSLKAIVAGVRIVRNKGADFVHILLVNCYVYQKNKKPKKISEHLWFQLSDIIGIDTNVTVSLGDVIAFSARFSEYKKVHKQGKIPYTTYGIKEMYVFNSGYPNLSKVGYLIKDNYLPINYVRHNEFLFQVKNSKFCFGKQVLQKTEKSGRQLYKCLVDLKMSQKNTDRKEFMPYEIQ